jgi:hypothetical protein
VVSSAKTVKEYLDSLPPDRRASVESVRKVIKKNLPRGYEEGMDYGMIGYFIPLSRYPDTYNGHPLSLACIASQKQYLSLYLMGVYGDAKQRSWFEREFEKSGKKLDMGKSCVRFKTAEDLPLELVGQAIAQVSVEDYIAKYEAGRKKVAQQKKATQKKTIRKKTKRKKA